MTKPTTAPSKVTELAPIDRNAIAATYARIKPLIRRTPVIEIAASDLGLGGAALTFKLELLQHAGSFKARGAFANLTGRNPPKAGVAAASGGNHGAAVAFVAGRLSIPATIFVPKIASPAKIALIESCGAKVVVDGDTYADALARCDAFIADSGALSIHAYDQAETILGQGSVGIEFETQAPQLDTVLVAVGGGGLIAGIAAWYEGRARIVGAEPATSNALHAALAAERPVDVDVSGIAADSLGARRVGTRVFPIARAFVEGVALVPDDAIRAAQALLWRALRIVAEPGGAAALAALMCGAYKPAKSERIGVLVCGGNTTAVDFAR
jgi:threonine dehydratase